VEGPIPDEITSERPRELAGSQPAAGACHGAAAVSLAGGGAAGLDAADLDAADLDAANLDAATIERFLRQAVGRATGVAGVALDRAASLAALGMDSLGAVELAGEVESALGVRLDLAEALASDSLAALAATLAARARGALDAVEPAAPPASPVAGPMAASVAAAGAVRDPAPGRWRIPAVARADAGGRFAAVDAMSEAEIDAYLRVLGL